VRSSGGRGAAHCERAREPESTVFARGGADSTVYRNFFHKPCSTDPLMAHRDQQQPTCVAHHRAQLLWANIAPATPVTSVSKGMNRVRFLARLPTRVSVSTYFSDTM
jgi:hypothetical protein